MSKIINNTFIGTQNFNFITRKHSNHTKGDTEMSDQPPAPIKIPEITPNQQENASSNENKIQNEAPAPTPVPTPTPSYSHPNPFESGFGDIFKSNLSYGLGMSIKFNFNSFIPLFIFKKIYQKIPKRGIKYKPI